MVVNCLILLPSSYGDKLIDSCVNKVAYNLFYDREILIINPGRINGVFFLNNTNYVYNFLNESLETIPEEINNYLIYVDNQTSSRLLNEVQEHKKLISPFTRVILIFENEDSITEYFETFWKKNIFKIVGIRKENLTLFVIDFDKFKCQTPIPLKRSSCSAKIDLNLFKLRNCDLKVTRSEYEAMLVDGNVTNSGLAMQLVRLISEKEKLNLHFNKPSNKYAFEIAESFTYYQVLDEFETGVSDIYIGIACSTYEQHVLFYCTYPVYEEKIYLIVPKPKLLSMDKLMYRISADEVALLFHASFAVGVAVLNIFGKFVDEKYFHHFVNCAIFLFALQIGSSVPDVSITTISLRFFLIFYYVHSLMFNNVWQAKLYAISVIPMYEKPIRTLRDVLDSGLTMRFQTSAGLLFLFRTEEDQEIFDRYEASNRTQVDGDMEDFVKTTDFITVANEINLRANTQYKKLYDKIPIFRFNIIEIMRMYHPFYEQYNSRVIQAHEEGFFVKWLNDAEWELLIQHTYHQSQYDTTASLEFKLDPILFIYKIGIILSIIVFVIEVLSPVFKNYIRKFKFGSKNEMSI